MCSEAGERTRYQNPSLVLEEISLNVSHSMFRHWEHPVGCPLLCFLSQLWPMVWFFRRSWRGGIHCIFLPTRTHILITPLLEKAIFFFLFYFLNYESMITHLQETWGGSAGKESACNAGELGSIPELGRSPGEEKGYPLQYSGRENSMDCIVHGVTKSWTRLSEFHLHCHFLENAEQSYI